MFCGQIHQNIVLCLVEGVKIITTSHHYTDTSLFLLPIVLQCIFFAQRIISNVIPVTEESLKHTTNQVI